MPDKSTVDWVPIPDGSSPYVDWWWTARGKEDEYRRNATITIRGVEFSGFDFTTRGQADPKSWPFTGGPSDMPSQANSISAHFFGAGKFVPIPKRMENGDFKFHEPWISSDFIDRLPAPCDIPDHTIVLGVIDTGVPLSHRRTQLRTDGRLHTRIISAWQQSADRSGGDACIGGNELLPFGLELTGPEIDHLIAAHSQNGPLDEDAFNRATQLTEQLLPFGQRDLDFRAAHGAHILDLAGGYDPDDDETKELAKRIRLVIVNLPTQALHGTAGHFLQYFASYAVERIRAISFALYAKKHGKNCIDEDVKGFPTIINLSYGMQAGPKDGYLPFERLVQALIRRGRGKGHSGTQAQAAQPETAPQRKRRGKVGHQNGEGKTKGRRVSPMRLAMPVGNNNLEQATARLELPKDQIRWLDWRVSPEDQTANFMEIWTDALPKASCPPQPRDFSICLEAPDGQVFNFDGLPDVDEPPAGSETKYCVKARFGVTAHDDRGYGRVFCTLKDFKTEAEGSDVEILRRRIQFLIALRPPVEFSRETNPLPLQTAPSGLWRVGISCHGRPIGVGVHIQSDQPFEIQNLSGRPSYFDDDEYRRFEDDGRLRDSFSYDRLFGSPSEYLEANQGPVKRVGSSNALAATRYIRMFSGFQETDGRPADYTATALLEPDFNGERRGADAAFPTDDGAAHFGVLGAGSRDGSAVAYRGASMATALSNRFLVEAICNPGDEDIERYRAFGRDWFKRQAEAAEARGNRNYSPFASAKLGAGRLDHPPSYLALRASRRGEY